MSLRDRFLGAILGAAIGDAMGHPTEFMKGEEIPSRYPPSGVTGFELWWERDGLRFAPYTDDTQMAEIVLRCLVEEPTAAAGLDPVMTAIAAGFVEWEVRPQGGHRAPGNACLSGARELAKGTHWSVAGGATAGGCGSVMRAYPFGLAFHDDPETAERWAVEHSKLTHRDPIALAACAAMAVGVCASLKGVSVEAVVDGMVASARRYDAGTAGMIEAAHTQALAGEAPETTLERLQGWAAHEAIAASAYVISRHPDDAAGAILEGANASGDSDSIATLAGALLGARLGVSALPEPWVRDVERSAELQALAHLAVSHVERNS